MGPVEGTSSPGLLCSHRLPLLSRGSQCCPAVGRHLPAGHSPVQHTSALALPGDKDHKRGMGLALRPVPGCHQRDLPPPPQLCHVGTTYSCRCGSGQLWAGGKPRGGAPGTGSRQSWGERGAAQGSRQPAAGPVRVQHPQQCPAPCASAPGLQRRAGPSWGWAGNRQAGPLAAPARTCSLHGAACSFATDPVASREEPCPGPEPSRQG